MSYVPDISRKGNEIPEVELTKTQEKICNLIVSVTKFFFKKGSMFENSPFRGFLLEGPPGNGKTEIARQAVRRLDLELGEVYLKFLDSASIAEPKWGEAEKKLREAFSVAQFSGRRTSSNKKIIMLFDDIDCLMIKRGSEVAREWHYSINSLMFHEIDRLNPFYVILIATTNRPSLIDFALRSRLYSIKVPRLSIEELIEIARRMIYTSVDNQLIAEQLVENISQKLLKLKHPTIRDVQHLVVTECIALGGWES